VDQPCTRKGTAQHLALNGAAAHRGLHLVADAAGGPVLGPPLQEGRGNILPRFDADYRDANGGQLEVPARGIDDRFAQAGKAGDDDDQETRRRLLTREIQELPETCRLHAAPGIALAVQERRRGLVAVVFAERQEVLALISEGLVTCLPKVSDCAH
jgi:hypothetical protein